MKAICDFLGGSMDGAKESVDSETYRMVIDSLDSNDAHLFAGYFEKIQPVVLKSETYRRMDKNKFILEDTKNSAQESGRNP